MEKETIHLSIKPGWEIVRILRDFMTEFLSLRINDASQIYDISFNISELVENAVKYSSKGHIVIDINYDDNNEIQFIVKNNAEEKQAEEFRNTIKKISEHSKEDILNEKFKSSSFWQEGVSSLGLVMINERISGKLCFSYNAPVTTVECKISLEGNQ